MVSLTDEVLRIRDGVKVRQVNPFDKSWVDGHTGSPSPGVIYNHIGQDTLHNIFSLFSAGLHVKHRVHYIVIGPLTYTERRRDAHAEDVLIDHEDDQKQTVLGPDLGNSFSAPPHHDGNQPASVNNDQEVHALANDIHCHEEANLKTTMQIIISLLH